MRLEKTEDLINWTYFMVKWEKEDQKPSNQKCVRCGDLMRSIETTTQDKGLRYEGLVCHNCKSLIWVKRS